MRARFPLSAASALAWASACSDVPVTAPDPYAPLDAGTAPVVAAATGSNTDAGRPGAPDAQADASAVGGGDAGDDGAVAGDPIGLAGTGLSVFPTSGEPLTLTDGKWTYVEFPDSSCRDGSKAGITVRRNAASKKLMFFFEGGGACFDSLTCGANPAAVDDKDRAGPSGGVLDLTRAENPFKDWNIVYVPYCTGDVFAGTKADGNVEGVGPQKFVGYLNTKAFLQRVAPTFTDLTDLLVTGVSAGGFGASSSVVLIQRAFPGVRGKLIDDSGPPMPASVLPSCLQKKWRETWGLEGSMLADCGADCSDQNDYTFAYGISLAKRFQGRFSGLIETTEDGIISGFFGAGTNPLGGGECTGIALLTPVGGATFHAGLLEFRKAVSAYSTFGTYFPPGSQHTWLMGDSFYTGTLEGTSLRQWVADIVDEKGTKHVGK
jgi:Pectinacetylesterase